MRLRYLVLLLALVSLAIGGSAQADTGWSANLDGTQEVPPIASAATGTMTLVLNNAQNSLSYNLTYQNLTVVRTAAHIHGPAAVGATAGVVHGLLGQFGGTSGGASGTWAIDATNVTRLFNGLLYVNVHNATYPGGEIRGQIYSNPTSTRSTTWGRLKRLYGSK